MTNAYDILVAKFQDNEIIWEDSIKRDSKQTQGVIALTGLDWTGLE
jgi:hypothetical protein